MGRMTKVTAAAAAALLVLGVAACGDDDDDDATTTTDAASGAVQGDDAAFCDAFVEFNSLAIQSDAGSDDADEAAIKEFGEQVAPLFQTVVDNAPEDLADQAAELNGTVTPLLDGDGEAFFSDEIYEQYTEFSEGAVDACGFEAIEVTAVDYGYEGVPATVEAGTFSINLTNSSEEEEHEMVVARKADGVDLTFDEILELSEDESESMVVFSGFAFAAPGESNATLATLEPGEYVMVCFIPVGGADDGPPHFTQGMKQEFTVE